jgi:cytochrome b
MRARKIAAAILRASARLAADKIPRPSHSEKYPQGELRMVASELVVRAVVVHGWWAEEKEMLSTGMTAVSYFGKT